VEKEIVAVLCGEKIFLPETFSSLIFENDVCYGQKLIMGA